MLVYADASSRAELMVINRVKTNCDGQHEQQKL
jgi:hypothetical protein